MARTDRAQNAPGPEQTNQSYLKAANHLAIFDLVVGIYQQK